MSRKLAVQCAAITSQLQRISDPLYRRHGAHYAFMGIGTGSLRVGIGAYTGVPSPVTRSAIFTELPVWKHWLAAAPIRMEYKPPRSSAARLYLSSAAVPKSSVSITLSPPPWPPVP